MKQRILSFFFAVGAFLIVEGCSSSENCQDIVNQYEAEVAKASQCDPTVANPCSVLLPVVVAQVLEDGGVDYLALARNCNGALNGTLAASGAEQLYSQYQAMKCQSDVVPFCQTGSNKCLPEQNGGPGYACYPN